MDYQDMIIEAFDPNLVRTQDKRVGQFKVRVLSSPAGAMRPDEVLTVEYDDKALQEDIQQLDARGLDRAGLIALGRKLAELMLSPDRKGDKSARDLYKASLDRISQDEGLRLRLRLHPQLAVLPWEYMYVDVSGGGDGMDGFLALNRRVAIVRYHEELPMQEAPPLARGNVKVVAALALPPTEPALQLSVERNALEETFKDQPGIAVNYLDNATWDKVQATIVSGVGVFHFAGHGVFAEQMGVTPGTFTGTGTLLFNDTTVKAEQVGITLHGSGVRLALLGACETGRRDGVSEWSGIAPALIKAEVPAVVANQFSILDTCAIAFHHQFYRALAAGINIEEAVSAGRIAAYNELPDGREWGVAVLYLQATHGQLFEGATDLGVRGQARKSVQSTQLTWDRLLERSKKSVMVAQGSSDRPGPFIPDIYVHRKDVESILNTFQESTYPGLILVGDSGVGKTNLLCLWATTLQAMEHAVFYNNCVVFTQSDIEAEVARAIEIDSADELSAVLHRISELAVGKKRQCILIFDAISEFHGANNAGAEALLKAINAFVENLGVQNVRVILACRTSTWSRLDFDTERSFSSQYYPPAQDEQFLHLDTFTPELVEVAYGQYAQFFHLQTPFANLPDGLREQLQNPFMLRLLAETYRNKPVLYENLALSIFKHFYESRIGLQDQLVLNKLVAEMLRQRRSIFPVVELAQNQELGSVILSNDSASSYNRLLDNRILTELPASGLFGGTMVKFSSDQLGGYILTRYLLSQPTTNVSQLIVDLIKDVKQFSLAWYTAQMLLIPQRNANLFASLAASAANIELRELIVEGLKEIYIYEQAAALNIIKQLLQNASQDVQRVGLKAAYSVNPPAREIFLWAATQEAATLRQLTRDYLYLIWRTDQTEQSFTYTLLHELTARLKPDAPQQLVQELASELLTGHRPDGLQEARNTVDFVFDLLVTIYINHCEQKVVIQQTSDIFAELTKTKLHLDELNKNMLGPLVQVLGPLGPKVEQLLVKLVVPTFSKPILDAMLFTDLEPQQPFFKLPEEERALLKQITPFLDPQTDLEQARETLEILLKSDVLLFKNVVALALSIHAYQDFARMKPFMRSLFEGQGGQGRLWILLSLNVLLPDTPREWTELAEEFTQRLIEEHPAIFFGDEPSVLRLCDMALLPLGLAYGKRGESMPYVETLLQQGLQQGKTRLVERCIEALGTVGFYYPKAVFHTLTTAIPNIATAGLDTALIQCLSTIRVLYFDAVDDLLRRIGADETLQREVSAQSDIDLVSRAIHLLGWQNNAVHFSLFYPKMRQRLSIGALNILAESSTPDDFITRYTLEVVHLTQETDFELIKWTLPD